MNLTVRLQSKISDRTARAVFSVTAAAIVLFSLTTLQTSTATADVDNGCFAILQPADGSKTRKAQVPRKSLVKLGKDLHVGFQAPAFMGEPVSAIFLIEDANDRSSYKTFTSVIDYKWQWNFKQETKYGLVTVSCF